MSQRDYTICRPTDGMLYVEVPSLRHLLNLLLTQRFRGIPHFRTRTGYVPYYAGGLAMDAVALRLHGVRPLWYLREGGDYKRALLQVEADGLYEPGDEERYNGHQYEEECEWRGEPKMGFDLSWVRWAWYGPHKVSAEDAKVLDTIREVFPKLELRQVGSKQEALAVGLGATFGRR